LNDFSEHQLTPAPPFRAEASNSSTLSRCINTRILLL